MTTPDKRVVPATVTRRHAKASSERTTVAHADRAALESLPHLVTRLTALWGYVECQPYLRRLIVAGPERENRSGFPRAVLDELVFLEELWASFQSDLLRETLSETQRDQLAFAERRRALEKAWDGR